MSLLCHLIGHAVAPTSLANQGFAFSRCLRCDHDMIRSALPALPGRWRRVPTGFRVTHPDRRAAPHDRHRRCPEHSLARDMLRLAGVALLWCLLDALRTRRPARIIVRRLGAA